MNFKTVILAAGKGKRLGQPFPKALTPIGGKPILQYLIESIKASKVESLPVVVIGPDMPELCADFGEKCDYARQIEQLGTGHALMSAKENVQDSDAVIVLYGDHPFISTETIDRLIDRHAYGDNAITMMTVALENFDEWHCAFAHWGRILRGEDGHIKGIREYKDASEEERAIMEVNPSLFCFDTKWMLENIDALKNENAQGEYYLTDLVEMAVEQGKRISSLEIRPEEAIGINTPEECKVAESVLMKLQD